MTLRPSPARAALVAAALTLAPGLRAFAEAPAFKVVTEAANPPFAEIGPDGQPRGFEVDLVAALCARLGRACRVSARDYERLEPMLLTGQADVIASSLVPSDERRLRLAFTRPYYHARHVLVGRKGEAKPAVSGPEPLAGRSLGVERGGALAAAAEEAFPEAELRQLGSAVEAYLDVAAGRLDYALGERVAVEAWLTSAPEARDCRIAGAVTLKSGPLAEGFALALRPRDKLLRARLDAALGDMMVDGSYAALAARYFAWDTR